MSVKSNILFICIDAFRADRCYGKNKSSKTPNIDYLIKNGTYFDQAFASSDETHTSFSSILTGLYSFKAMVRKGRWDFRLKPGLTDYITILKRNGYHAYATIPKLTLMEELISLYEDNAETYPYFGYRLFDGLGQQIVKKLESKKMKEPWFYFIHLVDAHKPISYPKEYDTNEYGDDDYDKTISSLDVWIGRFLQKIDLAHTLVVLTADHGDYLRIVTRNGKRISFEYPSFAKPALNLSKIIPRILYPLKLRSFIFLRKMMTQFRLAKSGIKLHPYEKRSIINTRSDPDRYLYDELVHVPLIFSGSSVPSLGVIQQQVRSIDIFPTIVEIVGIPSKNENVDGRSLTPLFNGKKLDELPVYLESGFNVISNVDPSKVVIGIRTPHYKYFRGINKSEKKVHLYDLINDPLEENNIAIKKPDVINEMEKILTEVRKDFGDKDGKKYEFIYSNSEFEDDERSKEIERELKKLGYI